MVCCLAGADAALVLPEDHVQDPVQGILDAPVAAHTPQQGPCIRQQAGNAVTGLRSDPILLPPLRLDHDQVVQVGPGPIKVHVSDVRQRSEHPILAHLDAVVVLFTVL